MTITPCSKCHGLLVFDTVIDQIGHSSYKEDVLRCVNCGSIIFKTLGTTLVNKRLNFSRGKILQHTYAHSPQ